MAGQMFIVKSQCFILNFHVTLKIIFFCTVLIINKEEITTVLFVYSANKLSYKL